MDMPTCRRLAGLLGLTLCACLPARARTEAVSGVASEVLAAAAESVFVEAARPRPAAGMLLVGDSATARALVVPARRNRLDVRVAHERVWCGGHGSGARTEGSTVTMKLGGITPDSAVVDWSVTCLLQSTANDPPFAGGSGGSYQLARRDRRWAVVGTLVRFSY